MIEDLKPTPEAFKLLMEGMKVFSQMEADGFRVDTIRLSGTIQEVGDRIQRMEGELKRDPVYKKWRLEYGNKANLDSDHQLANILYNKMGVECKTWTSGGKTGNKKPSVSEKALQDVDHPFVRKRFELRHLKKAVGTFLKGIKREVVDGYIHTFWNLHTAVTYRSSSSDPNLQFQPKRDKEIAELIRRCLISREGRRLAEFDFKAAEVITAASITKDPVLLDYVNDKTKDMHRDCAQGLYLLERDQVSKPIRHSAKSWFVFAEFYGDYYIHCAQNLWETVDREELKLEDGTSLRKHLTRKGIKELGDLNPKNPPKPKTYEKLVKDFEDDFWNRRFKGYTEWKKRWWEQYQENCAFVVPTGFLVQWGKAGCLTKNEALNSPIQSSAFHCNLYTLIRLHKWLKKNKMKSCIVAQVHDSAVLDVVLSEFDDVLEEAKRIVREDLPRKFKWLIAPMSIEISAAPVNGSWFEMLEVTDEV